MAQELTTQEYDETWDDCLNEATHAVIGAFDGMGLPDGDQLSDLMTRINDALTQIMAAWK